MKKILLFVSSAVITATAYTQSIKLSGEIRPRTEYSHGLKQLASPDQDANIATSQRSRLLFNYTDSTINSKIVLQDVRLWGSQPQLVANEANATSIHEAWAQVQLCKAIALKAGRMELAYDDHRILGNVGWAQQARSHDMALLSYTGDSLKLSIHLGATYFNDAGSTDLYTGPDAYKAMQFLWASKSFGKLSASILFLNNGKAMNITDSTGNLTEQEIKYSQTAGTHVKFASGDIKLRANFYYQFGQSATAADISALNFSVNADYNLSKKTKVGIGYEYLSGRAYDDTTSTIKTFAPLYGTNHKFNGHMDYFYVGYMPIYGLQDINATFSTTINKLALTAQLHGFLSAAKIADAQSEEISSYLGTEIDLSAAYKLSANAKIIAGYSHMLGTDSMASVKGGDTGEISNWAWLMLAVTPTFFTN